MTTVGGTSAVAPLYAGLFAAFGRKLGYVTPKLWLNQTSFNDITSGDNGFYRALVGPDPCSGIGSPIADKLAALFGAPLAAIAPADLTTDGEAAAAALSPGRRPHRRGPSHGGGRHAA